MSCSLDVQLEIKDEGIFIEQYKSQKKIAVSALYALSLFKSDCPITICEENLSLKW